MVDVEQSIEGNVWTIATSTAVKAVAARLPRVSCAVCASDRNVRAMAELHGPVHTHSAQFANAEGFYKGAKNSRVTLTVRTHPVQFVYGDEEEGTGEDEKTHAYPDCVVDVRDVRAAELAIWWLQVVAIRAVRLEEAGCLSALGMQHFLAALLSAQPQTAAGLALPVVLEKLMCVGSVSNYPLLPADMTFLERCQSLRRIQMRQCCHPDSLVGVEKMAALEVLQVTYTNISDLVLLRGCRHLCQLDLRGCRQVRTLSGLENLTSLLTLVLSGTSIDDLIPLQKCEQLSKLDLNGCTRLHSLAGLERSKMLETLLVYCTAVDSLWPIRKCRRLIKLDLRFAWELRSLAGLENLFALEEIMLSSLAKNVNTSAIPPNRKHIIKYY